MIELNFTFMIFTRFSFFRSNVCEQNLYQQIENMSWSEHDSGQVNQVVQGDGNSSNDFHRDSSLLMDVSGTSSIGFSDIADSSFRDIENLSLDDNLLAVLDHLGNQVGAGRDDYNIKLINERSLKDMKTVEVNYQITFNDKFFREKKETEGSQKHS